LWSLLGFDDLLTKLVTGWTDFEIALGSIARVKNFEKDVKPEHKEEEKSEPTGDWPAKGGIEFRNVTASHKYVFHYSVSPRYTDILRSEAAIGIRDVSLTISPGQKLGLCGRTGGGKSSLVGTILRLLEINKGSITIDGQSLSSIPRDVIRERIVTLPQDPLILVSTVRMNVDPLGTSSDEAIISVLSRVNLWEPVLRDREGGLNHELTPSSLSKGQQQLLALARALLKIRAGGKILLLDEPTSSMDADTDEIVHKVLEEECKECTVVTVAHRMKSILASDIVAVMEEGRVVEFGSPEDLVAQGGAFATLVES
jgi:ABC-type multidrug transport system fused ATPase/permease subunit